MRPTADLSQFSPSELSKRKTRRVKANGRERARMHGLNDALDLLRNYIPITTQHQKLSKIETLRLARNYIDALQRMLQTNEQPSALEYAHTLANGLSQTTTNMLANLLQVHPRQLLPPSQFDVFSDGPTVGSHPFSSASSTSSSSSPPQYYYSPTQPSAAPLQAASFHQQHHLHQQQHQNMDPRTSSGLPSGAVQCFATPVHSHDHFSFGNSP